MGDKNQQTDIEAMRHSLAHIMASAVKRLWPEVKLGIGPVVENGFYYDLDTGGHTISEENFKNIEKEMKKIIKEDQSFEQSFMDIDEAITWSKKEKQPFKEELLNDLKRSGTTVAKDLDAAEMGTISDGDSALDKVSFYTNGDFTDLCRGPHVESTGKVGAFKLMRVAGAYWRGDESKPQLQRLYGVGFASKEELDAHLEQLEEAKKRDHRKLGKELDLFAFNDLVGPGLPLFTPKGTILRDLLKRMLEQAGRKTGAQVVTTPHIAKIDLYNTSGHADKFGDELFKVSSNFKDVEFVMKPVSCPHHIGIYSSSPRSYKDLPISYMETAVQYRDEKPGELSGLGRVRSITVDDGHIFLLPEQIKEVAKQLAQWIEEFHTSLGLYGNHWVSLSVRDPDNMDQYTGTEEDWEKAEGLLEEFAEEMNLDAKRIEGEAALYGPKIDYMYTDVLGNERQLSTIQVDFATPARFGLEYTDSDGELKTPVMIHRAILGSYERFMAILIEQTAGHFPFWLAPEQLRIVTVNDAVADYVKEITDTLDEVVLMKPLKYNELRYTVDDRNESLGKKIREAEVQKIPITMIIGEKDKEAGEISLRTQDGETKIKLKELTNWLHQQ